MLKKRTFQIIKLNTAVFKQAEYIYPLFRLPKWGNNRFSRLLARNVLTLDAVLEHSGESY